MLRTRDSIGQTVALADLKDLLESSRYDEEVMAYHKAGGRSEPRLELTNRGYISYEGLEDSGEFYTYTIKQGDRIDLLAFYHLEDTRLWWVLAELNPIELVDTVYLPVGAVIKIPTQTFLSEIGLI